MTSNFPSDRTTLIESSTGVIIAPAAPDAADYLLIVDGEDHGRFIALDEQERAIGRVEPCDIVVPDKEISRRHCTVRMLRGALTVTDLGSTNGTYLDGNRITGTVAVPLGALVQIGRTVLKYERRSRKEVQAAEELARDLAKARRYVESLLPAPLRAGAITADWFYQPSTQLGGDVLGYHALDDRHFAVYLLDVSGHGVEACMLAVAAINVLRQRALPDTDYRRPGDVVKRLNAMFPMDQHNFMFFTVWYGVFDMERRVMDYCSAGHHPAFVLSGDRERLVPLRTANVPIGIDAEADFTADSSPIGAGQTLYLFSDGVFEIVTPAGERWELDDFLRLIPGSPVSGMSEPERLHHLVRRAARPGPLDDDFSLLTVRFD
jgi:serine phosphatase RsbU (regulator of sigma subunit)